MAADPEFEVIAPPDMVAGERLVVGIADFGVAGLTAVDYVSKHLPANQIGHVATRNLADLTPFSEGIPRYPMRLYESEPAELTLFVSEVVLPVWTADALAQALFEWLSGTDLREVTILFGAPFPHAEEEHVVFQVGNEPFRAKHFDESDIQPLAGGFFDGVVGELMTKGLAPDAPAIGTLVTPAHPPGPDLEGALRLIDGLERLYDITVETTALEESSQKMRQHYQQLAERMQTIRDSEQTPHHCDYPEDRMYM